MIIGNLRNSELGDRLVSSVIGSGDSLGNCARIFIALNALFCGIVCGRRRTSSCGKGGCQRNLDMKGSWRVHFLRNHAVVVVVAAVVVIIVAAFVIVVVISAIVVIVIIVVVVLVYNISYFVYVLYNAIRRHPH